MDLHQEEHELESPVLGAQDTSCQPDRGAEFDDDAELLRLESGTKKGPDLFLASLG